MVFEFEMIFLLSTQNSAKLHHREESTLFLKACATFSSQPASLLKT